MDRYDRLRLEASQFIEDLNLYEASKDGLFRVDKGVTNNPEFEEARRVFAAKMAKIQLQSQHKDQEGLSQDCDALESNRMQESSFSLCSKADEILPDENYVKNSVILTTKRDCEAHSLPQICLKEEKIMERNGSTLHSVYDESFEDLVTSWQQYSETEHNSTKSNFAFPHYAHKNALQPGIETITPKNVVYDNITGKGQCIILNYPPTLKNYFLINPKQYDEHGNLKSPDVLENKQYKCSDPLLSTQCSTSFFYANQMPSSIRNDEPSSNLNHQALSFISSKDGALESGSNSYNLTDNKSFSKRNPNKCKNGCDFSVGNNLPLNHIILNSVSNTRLNSHNQVPDKSCYDKQHLSDNQISCSLDCSHCIPQALVTGTHAHSCSTESTNTSLQPGNTEVSQCNPTSAKLKLPQTVTQSLKQGSSAEIKLEALTRHLEQEMDAKADFFGNCVKCNKDVHGANQACQAMGNLYHDACFTCCACSRKLRGKAFYFVNGKVFCEEDFLILHPGFFKARRSKQLSSWITTTTSLIHSMFLV
ncbi:LIM domain-containing 1 isoform X1 [Pelobates cultripes]|uniref:LIM domain-containing protein 1 n=1 Tax=Pelobates cultripes TaxID=61616 RepID=A0AAD1RY12_PELCU|nr:LIM domain-containing 1 isoform X1 [Pelobates cultripes]